MSRVFKKKLNPRVYFLKVRYALVLKRGMKCSSASQIDFSISNFSACLERAQLNFCPKNTKTAIYEIH